MDFSDCDALDQTLMESTEAARVKKTHVQWRILLFYHPLVVGRRRLQITLDSQAIMLHITTVLASDAVLRGSPNRRHK